MVAYYLRSRFCGPVSTDPCLCFDRSVSVVHNLYEILSLWSPISMVQSLYGPQSQWFHKVFMVPDLCGPCLWSSSNGTLSLRSSVMVPCLSDLLSHMIPNLCGPWLWSSCNGALSLRSSFSVASYLCGSPCIWYPISIVSPAVGTADAEMKEPSVKNQELKDSPFKAWSRSVYSHACYAYCQGFLLY